MDCIETIMTRRSIRKFKPDPVDEQDLTTILEAGRWAPSAGNLQPCYFVVVRDPAQRKQLKAAAFDQESLDTAPAVIVVCADPNRCEKYGEKGMTHFLLMDGANATQNILLAARALGYGSCWMGGFSEKKVRELLGLPDHFRVISVVPIGKADEDPEPRERRPLSEIVKWERW
ncbi:MAG TPA: nitroreductase family protein [Syntrophomonadaceae bacterium]|nr:nitroreductase family protein [Syntrophomonadaceae bacterium]